MHLSSTEIHTLAALIAVYRRDGRATVRTVARERGRGVSTTHSHLIRLERAGLVGVAVDAYGKALIGTLRPLVEVVA